MQRCKRWCTRFLAAQEGVSAIEFAVVAPALCLLIMSIIEFSLVMTVYNVMESATTVSSRLGATGFTSTGTSRQQTILNSIISRAGSLIDPDALQVSTQFYRQFDQIHDPEPYIDANGNGQYDPGESFTDVNGNGQWDADMAQAGLGSAGDVVVYTVTYPWHITTPIVSAIIGHDGIFTITTHAVTKNEPF